MLISFITLLMYGFAIELFHQYAAVNRHFDDLEIGADISENFTGTGITQDIMSRSSS